MLAEGHSWDFLSEREAVFTQSAMEALVGVAWATPLLAAIAAKGGLTRASKDLLFELRFGYELSQVGIELSYEVSGEGDSMLDFGFTSNGKIWRVEMMRLGETEAAKAAINIVTDDDGMVRTSQLLTSDAVDLAQSVEGETLKAVQRICQKCERAGHPHKFSVPDANAVNVLLIDMRLFLHGSDIIDHLHIAFGAEYLPPEFQCHFKGRPITGVFAGQNEMRGVAQVRSRVHFLGFVNEEEYGLGQFGQSIQFVANPSLFDDTAIAKAALARWPLQPAKLLNVG